MVMLNVLGQTMVPSTHVMIFKHYSEIKALDMKRRHHIHHTKTEKQRDSGERSLKWEGVCYQKRAYLKNCGHMLFSVLPTFATDVIVTEPKTPHIS